MTDDIQERLERLLLQRDWRFLADLIRDLVQEAEPLVARFRSVSDAPRGSESLELVQRILLREKQLPDGRPTKYLWPGGRGTAWKHRQFVVVSQLRDDARAKRFRTDRDNTFAAGGTPDELRELRHRRKAERQAVRETPRITAQPVQPAAPRAGSGGHEQLLRRDVLTQALGLVGNVRRRVAVALEYGFDPGPWAEELALNDGTPLPVVLERLRSLRLETPHAGLRLLYPEQSPELCEDAFRKLVANGLRDLKGALEQRPELRDDLADAFDREEPGS